MQLLQILFNIERIMIDLKIITGADICLWEETVKNRNTETGHHLHHFHGRTAVLLSVRGLQEWGELQGASSSVRKTSPGPGLPAVQSPSLYSQHSRGPLSSTDGEVKFQPFFSQGNHNFLLFIISESINASLRISEAFL